MQLKETAERIKAVDRAAAMVEEMLKLGPNSQPSPTVLQALNSGVQVFVIFQCQLSNLH